MPYINKHERAEYDDFILHPATPGRLNYIISKTCNQYLIDQGISYSSLNEVIGVLECAKLELYRRVVASYEDEKLKINGEVYTVV